VRNKFSHYPIQRPPHLHTVVDINRAVIRWMSELFITSKSTTTRKHRFGEISCFHIHNMPLLLWRRRQSSVFEIL